MNRFFKFLKKKNIYSRLFLYNLIFLVLMLLLSSFIYAYLLNVMERDAIQANTSILTQSMETLEIRLSEVESVAREIQQNKSLQVLLYSNSSLDGKEIYSVRTAANALPDYSVNSSLIDCYYVYCAQNDIVLMSGTAYIRLNKYYSNFFNMKDYDIDQWRQQILEKYRYQEILPVCEIVQDGKTVRQIPYIFSISSANGQLLGQTVFLLSEEYILSQFDSIFKTGTVYACIVDDDEQIITDFCTDSADPDSFPIDEILTSGMEWTNANGECMIISQVHSEKYGWTYLVATPQDAIAKRTRPIRDVIVAFNAAILILGLVIAATMASRSSRPFCEMLEKLRPLVIGGSITDEIKVMNAGISSLINSKEEIAKNMVYQREMLKKSFIIRLFNGEFTDRQEMESFLAQMDLSFKTRRFRVVLITLETNPDRVDRQNLQALDLQCLIVEKILDTPHYTILFHLPISKNCIALLWENENEDTGSNGPCTVFCSNMHENLLRNYSIKTKYYIGWFFEDLMDTSGSYNAAKQMKEFYITDSREYIIEYQDSNRVPRCMYTIDDERMLMNQLLVGNYKEAERFIGEIYDRNFSSGKMAVFMIRVLLYGITGTFIKVLDSGLPESIPEDARYELEKKIEQIPDCLPVLQAFDLIANCSRDFCLLVNRNKKSHNQKLIQEIIDYINNQYSDFNLCLSSMSL